MNEDRISLHREIKFKAEKGILYTPHAIAQMNSETRMITAEEVERTINIGKIIENYPEDKRGHSCLINALVDKRNIHVVCAPKDEYVAIITAYIPHPEKWNITFDKREIE